MRKFGYGRMALTTPKETPSLAVVLPAKETQ